MRYIIPVMKNKYGFGDCLQATLQTAAYNYGHHYEYLPVLYFGFYFTMDTTGIYSIDKAGLIDNSATDWLRVVHGLHMDIVPFSHTNIKDYIQRNIPVSIIVDTFNYCNSIGYQQIHSEHDLLVNVIDDRQFLCCDPYSLVQNVAITPCNVTIKNEMIVLQKDEENHQLSLHDLLILACENYLNHDYQQKITLFYENLKKIDITDYLGSTTKAVLSPFFIRYRSIIANRYALLSLVERTLTIDAVLILKKATKVWNNSYMLFMKLLSTHDNSIRDDIVKQLMRIAELEYEFCRYCLL